jgi:serpin B
VRKKDDNMRRLTQVLLILLLSTPMSAAAFAQDDDTAQLVTGNTAFALNLYAAIRQDAGDANLLFSPYSVSQALAMTYAGAEGETATQMAETLGFTLPQPLLHAVFSNLNTDLITRGNGEANEDEGEVARALRIANRLWGEQTYPFSPVYTAELERYYGAGLQPTDFAGAPEEARGEINDWVADQTEDRIENIVPEGAISPDTRLVLANAIWFYGGWLETFSPESTEDGDFFLTDGTTTTAPFMYQWSDFPYARGDGFQVIELPYSGSGFRFTVILPDEGEFVSFEENLAPAALNTALGQLESTEVQLHLPKFEFEYGTSLADILHAMGMTDAFDPTLADFTGMVEGTPPAPLFIGDVLHKAFISLDENGTEAAAATVIIMEAGAAPPEEEPIELRIDRPFLFAIRDVQTGTILFLGRVTNPSA